MTLYLTGLFAALVAASLAWVISMTIIETRAVKHTRKGGSSESE